MTSFRATLLGLGLALGAAQAAPYRGDTLTFRQPDGSLIRARAFGDEAYVRLEGLDGYTLTQDPVTRWFQYAKLGADAKTFVSTGVDYTLGSPPAGARGAPAAPVPASAAPAGLAKGERLPREERLARRAATLALLRKDQPAGRSPSAAPGAAAALTGNVRGLTLLVDFSDDPAAIPQTEIADYLNRPGYAGYANNGSVRDYFHDVSGGQLTYTNHVTAYYRALRPKTYYTDPAIGYTVRARELIGEALRALDAQGFDFSTLSADNGVIRAINMFYAGYVQNAWAEGLWPHMSGMNGEFSADGVTTGPYQVTNIGDALSLGTFCHENGHMLFGWPDLYDVTYESTGLGSYCLMAYQGPGNNPVPPNPHLRAVAGWETATLIPPPSGTATYTHVANSNTHFRFDNPAAANEFFLIESRRRAGRNLGLPDEGLLIWHVDTFGWNGNNDMTPQSHYLVSVEQADGQYALERNLDYGGDGDLFHAGYRSEFADWTLPDSRWWSGQASGLNLVDIGPVGATQSFRVQMGDFRTLDIGNPGQAGSATTSGGTVTLEGGGADIWGTSDQFLYRYRGLSGDGEILARFQSLENTDPWAKAGLMIRESTEPGSRNAMLAVTPGNGITFQSRSAPGGGSVFATTPGSAPRWLRVVRRGNLLTGYHSTNGTSWTAFGSATLALGENVLAGIAVTSHNNSTLATAVVSDVQILPSPWKSAALGAPALAGSYAYDNAAGAWSVRAAGTDIWGTADQGLFLHRSFTGDGRLIARVASLQNTNAWAKAGLMIRSGLDANSPNVFVAQTVANGATFQVRGAAGAATTSTVQGGLAAPRWLKLESRGGLLSGFQSADGAAWTPIGVPAAGLAPAHAGLAVTSHNAASLTTAVFDRVTVDDGLPSLYLNSIGYTEVTGNGDADINPGEEFTMDLTLYNGGAAAARSVTGTLASSDTCITLLSASAAYGDVAATSPSQTRSFRFRASPACGYREVPVTFTMTEAYGDRWETGFSFVILTRSSVSGTVRTPAGPAPDGSAVQCTGFRVYYSAEARPDGTYTVEGLAPGTYDCAAYAPGYFLTPSVAVTVPPARTGLDFLLTRPGLQLDRTGIAESLGVGQSRSLPLTLSNPGDAPLQFQLAHPGAGYLWKDSDAPGGPAYAWTDIRSTGTRLSMAEGASGTVGLRTLGFPFPFYGTGRNTLVIARSGYVAFEDHYPWSFNTPLPGVAPVPALIAGFWDEIEPDAARGAVYFQEFADRAVIQYDGIPRLNGGAGTYTFQIVLHRDGTIRFYYRSMGAADGATVGIQGSPERGIGVVADAPYVRDNLAVEFRPLAREWLTVSPASGAVNPGGSLQAQVGLDATALAAGTYVGRLLLSHNAPAAASPMVLPVSLTVTGAPGGARAEVWTGVPGTTLSALLAHPAYPRTPDLIALRPAFESPQNAGDNYGERLRAYVTPPVTGDYTFWIAGDDQCELRLSPDDHPGRAVAIARVSGWTGFRNWTANAEQRSAPVRLEAGRRYYLEALHKEGVSGDHVSVGWQGPGMTGDAERPIPGARLTPFDPAAWAGADIGGPGRAGSQAVAGTGLSVSGGGADIWGTSDQFRFAYRPLVGDGQIVARVVSLQNTNAWAKAGVMIRESLAANSRHAYMAVSAASGLAFQRRVTAGATTSHTGLAGSAPRWVRLQRAGNLITAAVSADGSAWTTVGTETMALGTAVWAGVAVTSHDNAQLSTAVFESVSGP